MERSLTSAPSPAAELAWAGHATEQWHKHRGIVQRVFGKKETFGPSQLRATGRRKQE